MRPIRAIALAGLIACTAPAAFGAAAPVTVVLLGDGYVNDGELNPPDRFRPRLTEALAAIGVSVTITSPGFKETTKDGLNWLTNSPDGQALLAAPAHHAVILELGVLDCSTNSAKLPLEETKANLTQMLTLLAAAKIPVLLVGQKSFVECGVPYFDAFNKMYPELARQFGLPLFPDYLDATYGHPELVHEGEAVAPNQDGVRVIIAKMLPMVKVLLENVDKP